MVAHAVVTKLFSLQKILFIIKVNVRVDEPRTVALWSHLSFSACGTGSDFSFLQTFWSLEIDLLKDQDLFSESLPDSLQIPVLVSHFHSRFPSFLVDQAAYLCWFRDQNHGSCHNFTVKDRACQKAIQNPSANGHPRICISVDVTVLFLSQFCHFH